MNRTSQKKNKPVLAASRSASVPARPISPSPSVPTPSRFEASRSTSNELPEEVPPYFIAESEGRGETEIVVSDEIRRAASSSARLSRVVPPVADVRSENVATSGSEIAPKNRAENRSAANSVASVSWFCLSENELAAIWLDATRELGFMLPTQAAEFCGVRAEAPNAFYVSFPGDRRMQRDYCDREKTKIVASLAEKLGGAVVFHCVLDETKKASDAPNRSGNSFGGSRVGSSNGRCQRSGASAPSAPRENVRDLYRKVEENDVIRQVKEFFDAELAEVRPPEESR